MVQQSGLVVCLFALSLFISCTYAAIIYAPVPPKPVGANEVVALILENPTTNALPSQYITFGHPFYKTQLVMPANTTIMSAYFTNSPSTLVDVQVDAKAHHTDGSVKQATLTVLHPTIAASSSITLMLTRTLRVTTPLALSGLPNNVVTVSLTSNVSANFNFDVKQLATGATTPDYWLKGELAVQTRVNVYLFSSLRMVFDTTLYKDNSWCVDVIYANDIFVRSNFYGGTVFYSTTITPITGSPITYSDLVNYQYQGFHKKVCSSDSQVNVQYDQLNMIQAAAIFPINYTIGFNGDSYFPSIRNKMSAATWNTPFNPNGVDQYMPGTGDRWDIGAVTYPTAAWFVSQNAEARKYMMGWGDACNSVPWHFYVNTTLRYFNHWDTAGFTIGSITANGWTYDGAHTPSLPVVPYLVTGSRYYLDMINAEATWKIMRVWSLYRGNYNNDIDRGLITNGGIQGRESAWALRDVDWAAWFNPSGSWYSTYFNSVVKDNLEFMIVNNSVAWDQKFGNIAGFAFMLYGNKEEVHAPWQDDFMVSAFATMALHGYSRAADVLMWMRKFIVMSALSSAWNKNNRMAYNIIIGFNSSVMCQEYQCIQGQMERWEQDVTDLSKLPGNYGQLARQSFILYQLIFPQDADAAAAQRWSETSNVAMITLNDYQTDPRTNAGKFPLAVPLNYTFTPGTPGPTQPPGATTTSKPTTTPTPKPTATSGGATSGSSPASTGAGGATTGAVGSTTEASPGTTTGSEIGAAVHTTVSVLLGALLCALAVL